MRTITSCHPKPREVPTRTARSITPIWYSASKSLPKRTSRVERKGASRFAQRQIERHRRLAPVADVDVGRLTLYERLRGFVVEDWLGVICRLVPGSTCLFGPL